MPQGKPPPFGKTLPRQQVLVAMENNKLKKAIGEAQAAKGKIDPKERLKMYESVVDRLPLNNDGISPVKAKMEAELPKKYKARLELYMKGIPYREVYSSRADLWDSIFWEVLKSS
jgi:hypothetical protein